jgi:hypothetical protein
MSGPTMKWLLGPKTVFCSFSVLERDTTNLRDTLVKNVKKVENKPTLLYSVFFIHKCLLDNPCIGMSLQGKSKKKYILWLIKNNV